MLQAALASGEAHRRCVFEAFARRLPDGRRYGVIAGTGRVLEALEKFRFGDDELRFLSDQKVVDRATVDWLEGYRFSGDVSGYAEGECYFPQSPVLVVESTFAEGVILETLVLSILNHDTAIASAASRMTTAAIGRPCIEMGSRRTHEASAVAAARAAYIAGFDASSNLEAGRRYGVPTTGTAAHAFTLLYDSEKEAFTAQVESLARARPSSSTPTTSGRPSPSPWSSPGPSWGQSGSTRATCSSWPPRCAPSSTRRATPTPGSSSPPTWTSTPSRAWLPDPSAATASARPS